MRQTWITCFLFLFFTTFESWSTIENEADFCTLVKVISLHQHLDQIIHWSYLGGRNGHLTIEAEQKKQEMEEKVINPLHPKLLRLWKLVEEKNYKEARDLMVHAHNEIKVANFNDPMQQILVEVLLTILDPNNPLPKDMINAGQLLRMKLEQVEKYILNLPSIYLIHAATSLNKNDIQQLCDDLRFVGFDVPIIDGNKQQSLRTIQKGCMPDYNFLLTNNRFNLVVSEASDEPVAMSLLDRIAQLERKIAALEARKPLPSMPEPAKKNGRRK